MSKKKTEQFDEHGNVIIGQLKNSDYWEWRCIISEYLHAQDKAKIKQLLHGAMEKDLEIGKLKSDSFKTVVNAERSKIDLVKAKLEDFYDRIEKDLGFNMRNSNIDEITYEVKKLKEDLT